MSWLRGLLVAAAFAALSVAAVVAWAPGLLEPTVDLAAAERAVAGEAGFWILAGCGLLAALIALWKGFSASVAEPDPLVDPAGVGSTDRPVAGQSFDESLDAAVEGGWAERRRRAREDVRARLTATAADRIAAADGRTEENARERVVAGGWTDDRVVASFLGDETAPDAPLSWRLYEWLYDDRAFDRAVERTVTEIEGYGEDRGWHDAGKDDGAVESGRRDGVGGSEGDDGAIGHEGDDGVIESEADDGAIGHEGDDGAVELGGDRP